MIPLLARLSQRPLARPLSLGAAFAVTLACQNSSPNEDDGDSDLHEDGSGGKVGANGGAAAEDSGSSSGSRGGSTSSGGRGSGGRVAAGGQGDGSGASQPGGDGSGGGSSPSGGASNAGQGAKDLANRLGRDHFLMGMGNDIGDDVSLSLGPTLDLRYAYLSGLLGQNGWPDWNEGGMYPVYFAQETAEAGVVPMFTLYSMAASGEGNGNSANDPSYMDPYWQGAKLLFQNLDTLDGMSVVHFEPDWWAFAQQLSEDPEQMPAKVGSVIEECADLPENMTGMGRCLVKLARMYSPKTLIGFHASTWASPDPAKTAEYLLKIGAGEADLVITDILDRDAGCFEARGAECTRDDGPWYLDETNQSHPNYNDLTSWAKEVTDRMLLPMLWWQVPFGVPSDEPGGEPGNYRDNKVKYIFEHIDEFAAVGGVGAVFGVGAGNQTYPGTDGDQFKNAVNTYFDAPYKL